MISSAVEAKGLTKIYRDVWRRETQAVADVSLRVEAGVIFGLLGANGAGKTTLVKMLLGIVRPTAGAARVLGRRPDDARARKGMGYLPEVMRLPPYLKAQDFLHYMGRLNAVDGRTLAQRIPTLLELVGLAGEKKRIGAFSKGMTQRLGLAQALVNDPDLLFLDEPTEGLDPLGRKQVRDLLLTLKADGKTIFLNSHLLSEIELVCDRLVVLRQGAVAREGAPGDFTRATGEYRMRLARLTDGARAAIESLMGSVRWDGTSVWVRPRDRAHLNALIDELRASHVEIEAIEPARSTLEEFFIEVVAGGEA